MPTRRVGTLSSQGWVGGREKAVKLFQYFLRNNYSQSTLFYGGIKSLPYLIKQFGQDLPTLKDAITDGINSLYERCYNDVKTTISIEDIPDTPNRYSIKIDVGLADNDGQYSLGDAITTDGQSIITPF